jgi:hypothetical protein
LYMNQNWFFFNCSFGKKKTIHLKHKKDAH